jgi:hypothetical protein
MKSETSRSRKRSAAQTLVTVCALVLPAIGILMSCGGGEIGPPPPRQLVSLTVQPNSTSAIQGDTVSFSATGTFNQAPVTENNLPAQWTSSDTNTASIDANTGAATCVSIGGPITISALAAGKGGMLQGTATLTCQISPNPVATLNPPGMALNCSFFSNGIKSWCACDTKQTSLTNTGGAPLNISGISPVPAPFSEHDDCATALQTSQSCTITMKFSPTSLGYFGTFVFINDDAINSPQILSVAGNAGCHQ